VSRDFLSRIRQSSLSLDQVNLLRALVQAGGEAPIYVDHLRNETRDRKIAKINSLIARDYVEVDLLRSSEHRSPGRATRPSCSARSPPRNGKSGVMRTPRKRLALPTSSPAIRSPTLTSCRSTSAPSRQRSALREHALISSSRCQVKSMAADI